MKKCLVSHIVLGLSLVALPMLSGCTQNAGGSNPFVSSASADTVSSENNLAAVTDTVTNAAEVTAEAVTNLVAVTNAPTATTNAAAETGVTATEIAPLTEQKPPTNLHLSPVLSEAVKIAQSGVDQSVLHNFITNTTGYFMLGADEIVYLNDLGVEGNVITAMMEHDKALRELRANAWQEYAASNQTAQLPQPEQSEPDVAAAPSYIESPAMEAEPVYVSDNYFDDTLSPYGTWVYVPGYGRCWRPTAAYGNPGWRPYCDRGRWVYSDSGWYWLSDYTWGATTFHYGRWFNDARVGWCWWPDTVWAPSWVSWRYTSDYCGWAPLPPNCYYQSGFGLMYTSGSVGVSFGFGLGYNSYAFVPWGSFCAPQPYRHCVPASRAVHVYKDSTPFNHWEGGGNGKAYNRGLSPERVRSLSRTEVRTVSLNEQAGRSRRAERIERDGRTLTVRRPQFASTQTDIAVTKPDRTGGRPSVTQRTTEPSGSTPQGSPAPTASTPVPSTTARLDTRNQRMQSVTTGLRPVTPVSRVEGATVESKPAVTATPQLENRTDRKNESQPVSRPRPTSVVVVRSTQQTPTQPAANVNQPTSTETKITEPRVIQPNRQAASRPTAPAQRSSIIVIGNGNNSRSGGRDYSVWSTSSQPPQAPAPSSPQESNPRNSQPTPVNSPAVADQSTAPATRAQNENWQNRGNYTRPDNRANQSYAAPQGGQVNSPGPRSTPPPTYNARPAASAPAQNLAPRSQPAAQPSAARAESRPAPAQTRSSAPAAASSSGQAQGRPNR